MTSAFHHFSNGYAEARGRFLDACAERGILVDSRRQPLAGPEGETLAMDLAWIGDRDAERVFVTVSGTHGIEGFSGSGVQLGWIEDELWRELPAGVAMLVVHALNPHGFAWLRRVNEDNVDLNRNFVDHDKPYPPNPIYDKLAASICPADWSAESLAAAQGVLDAYSDEHGADALRKVVARGQYSHPDGIFFGGAGPGWSNRTFREAVREYLAAARHVALMDFHTGLGPYGHGEIIALGASDEEAALFVDWYGDEVTSPFDGSSVSGAISGSVGAAVVAMLPHAAVHAAALEFGTIPSLEVRLALRADNWLHAHGDPDSPKGREIKARIRDAFYPRADDWKAMVFERCIDVQRQTLAGLARVV